MGVYSHKQTGKLILPSSQKLFHPKKCPTNMPIGRQKRPKQTSIFSSNFITFQMHTGERDLYFSFYIKQFHLGKDFFLPFSKAAQPGMQSSAWSETMTMVQYKKK